MNGERVKNYLYEALYNPRQVGNADAYEVIA
jgi:hypothetical protein